jgi:hypothetical protein
MSEHPSTKKEQRKLQRIHWKLVKLDKKIQKIETDISVLSLDSSVKEEICKEVNNDV